MNAKVVWEVKSEMFLNNRTLYILDDSSGEEVELTAFEKISKSIGNKWQEMTSRKQRINDFNSETEDSVARKAKIDKEMLNWHDKNVDFILMADTGFWGKDRFQIDQCVIVYFNIKANFHIGFMVDKFVMQHVYMLNEDADILSKNENVSDWIPGVNGDEIINPDKDSNSENEEEIEVEKDPSNFIWPLKNKIVVTSRFGKRTFRGTTRQHKGVDLRCKLLNCIASQDGTVVSASYKSGYGLVVYIKHSNGWETRYAHLDKIYVSTGQKVKQGELIGITGKSGGNYDYHLHFEIRDKTSMCYDPTKIITQNFEFKAGV